MSQETIETKNQSSDLPTPITEHKQLGVWVGKWNANAQLNVPYYTTNSMIPEEV